MRKYQDIHLEDIELKKEFIEKFIAGQYFDAFDVINNNPQLDTKAFKDSVMNIIYNSLTALQNYYYVNCPNFLQIQLEKFNEMINNFIYKNAWNFNTVYQKYHFVVYVDGLVYMYINDAPSNSHNPTETEYWLLIGLRGEQGDSSVGTLLRYNWDSSAIYNKLDVVIYGDSLYVAKEENFNKNPLTNPVYWEIFLTIPKIKILISNLPPTTPFDGMIWFQVYQTYTWADIDAKNYDWEYINNIDYPWYIIDAGGW